MVNAPASVAIVAAALISAAVPAGSTDMWTGDLAWARAPLTARTVDARVQHGAALCSVRRVALGARMVAAATDDGAINGSLRSRARRALAKMDGVVGWLKGVEAGDKEYCNLPTSDDPDARDMDKGSAALPPLALPLALLDLALPHARTLRDTPLFHCACPGFRERA